MNTENITELVAFDDALAASQKLKEVIEQRIKQSINKSQGTTKKIINV